MNNSAERWIKTTDIVHIVAFGALKPLYFSKLKFSKENKTDSSRSSKYCIPVLNSFGEKCRFKIDVVQLNTEEDKEDPDKKRKVKLGRLLLENRHISDRNKFGIHEVLTYNQKNQCIDSVKASSDNFDINSIFVFETGSFLPLNDQEGVEIFIF